MPSVSLTSLLSQFSHKEETAVLLIDFRLTHRSSKNCLLLVYYLSVTMLIHINNPVHHRVNQTACLI